MVRRITLAVLAAMLVALLPGVAISTERTPTPFSPGAPGALLEAGWTCGGGRGPSSCELIQWRA